MIIVGVDGGGTKTSAMAVDLNGNIIGFGKGGSSNILESGETITKKSLEDALKFLRAFPKEDLAVGMGMPACGEFPDVEKAYSKIVEEILGVRPLVIVNDVVVGWYAGTKGKDGIHIVAGTGSIAYAKRGGRDSRCGGWGSIIGDEGSAYYIGLETLRAVSMQIDGRMNETILKKLVFEHLSLKDDGDFLSWIYSKDIRRRERIASVAPIAYEAAKIGDEVALDILRKSGIELGKHILALYKKLGFSEAQVSYSGSVLEKNDFVRESFEDFVRSSVNVSRIKSSRCRPVYGAVIMTFEKLGIPAPQSIDKSC